MEDSMHACMQGTVAIRVKCHPAKPLKPLKPLNPLTLNPFKS